MAPNAGKQKIGPKIVESWFATVINPVLRALEVEIAQLESKDWTWTFRPQGLAGIFRVAAHVVPEATDNLEHLAEHFPEVGKLVENHDAAVKRLYEGCLKVHKQLSEHPKLRELYQELTTPEKLAPLKATLRDLFGAYKEEDHLRLLSQYIVNNKRDLPSHILTNPFWNEHKERFLELLGLPEIAPLHKGTQTSGEELEVVARELQGCLKRLRKDLAETHDVPYVPPGSTASGTMSVWS